MVFFLLVAPAGGDEPDDIPVLGRPADLPFSGASGSFTKASLTADPTTLSAEATVTLVLQIRADGPVAKPPGRIDLGKLLVKRFYIEDSRAGDDRQPEPYCWEFVYRIKPRQPGALEVPSLPFVYFNPAFRLTRRPFNVLHTDPIPLTVQPAPAYQVPLEAPDRFFDLAAGPGLFTTETPWTPPHPVFLIFLLLGVPLAGFAWYLVWRRLNPDAARLAGRRRTRAAREALHRLRRAAHLPARQQADLAASAVAGYLRQRFDLPVAEPTPLEAGDHLRRAGCSGGADDVTRFLQSCDAARFKANGAADSCELASTASAIILAVETESCPPSSS